jgi:hypothetical protein
MRTIRLFLKQQQPDMTVTNGEFLLFLLSTLLFVCGVLAFA